VDDSLRDIQSNRRIQGFEKENEKKDETLISVYCRQSYRLWAGNPKFALKQAGDLPLEAGYSDAHPLQNYRIFLARRRTTTPRAADKANLEGGLQV